MLVISRLKVLWVFYASWLWWSTMYLTHHYFVDLTGGAVLSLVVFEFVKFKYLPKANKRCRWSYTELEYYSTTNDDPLGGNSAATELFAAAIWKILHIQEYTHHCHSSNNCKSIRNNNNNHCLIKKTYKRRCLKWAPSHVQDHHQGPLFLLEVAPMLLKRTLTLLMRKKISVQDHQKLPQYLKKIHKITSFLKLPPLKT